MTPAEYKSERQRRGLSQAALAALLGVSRGCINYREAGHPRYPITREAWLAVQSLPLPILPWWVKREWNPEVTDARDCVRCGVSMRLNDGAEWDEDPAYNICNNCAHELVRECMDKLNLKRTGTGGENL